MKRGPAGVNLNTAADARARAAEMALVSAEEGVAFADAEAAAEEVEGREGEIPEGETMSGGVLKGEADETEIYEIEIPVQHASSEVRYYYCCY